MDRHKISTFNVLDYSITWLIWMVNIGFSLDN